MSYEDNLDELLDENDNEESKRDKAYRRKMKKLHNRRKMDIINDVPEDQTEMKPSKNGRYYTYTNHKSKPAKSAANRKYRRDITITCPKGNQYKKNADID